MSDLRKKLLTKTVGAKKQFKRISFEYEGDVFEFLEPTIAERREIMKKVKDKDGNFDDVEFMVQAIILTCVEPNSNDKLFDQTHVESMLSQPAGSFVTDFGMKAVEVLMGNTEVDAVGKPEDSQTS